ncbi:MAG: glycosyltransferase family 4 protein [Gelidibacter sp.]
MKKNVLYIGSHLQSVSSNPTYSSALGSMLEEEGYEVLMASSQIQKGKRLLDMLRTTFIRRSTIDVVLIDTYSTQNFIYAYLVSQLCRVLGLPYIPILHGGNLLVRLQNNPYMSTAIFKNAYINIAPSQFIREAFEPYGFTNVRYIPNAVRLETYPYKVAVNQLPKLLWVRAFSEIYNPQLAVKVLKSLCDKGYNATLTMVGPIKDDSFKATQALATELGLSVCFTGKLTQTEWMRLATEHSIFLNTTNFDNRPLSVIEAMALGLPIVSTNVGGMPYLITDQKEGLLVNPNDVEAMSEAVVQILEDTDLQQRLKQHARLKVTQFDWKTVKKSWSEVLS